MNTAASLSIGAALIIGVGGLVFWQKEEAKEAQLAQQAAQDLQNQEPRAEQGTYTLANILEHKDKSSCWSTINGNVYDLTSWVPKHPGGEQAILQLCGKDGSLKFNGQHGGSAMQEQALAGFKIGTLSN